MSSRGPVLVGLDVGSVSVKAAEIDLEGRVVSHRYRRHRGQPLQTSLELLEDWDDHGIPLVVTGTGSQLLQRILGVEAVNEVVAHGTATSRLYPEARTVFEMGGEDSKCIMLENGRIADFFMNALCAAGTGSFLDQQAERLNLGIEEFGSLCLEARTPPRIAGRCSVFAKSDMIHLQQIATPVADVAAGLCFAVARNFKSAICRGKPPVPPVVFQGGVASNQGMVRAFREVFGLDEIIVPRFHLEMGAVGAAFMGLEKWGGRIDDMPRAHLERLRRHLANDVYMDEAPMRFLLEGLPDFAERHPATTEDAAGRDGPAGDVYLGIDIGSISTNLVVVDPEGSLLAKRYLMTAGRPIDAVRRGVEEIAGELDEHARVVGVGTTGSGRYMIADFVGADVVKNEITAQAAAAAFIDPGVESILEIGGQDSKYIALRNGGVVDFEMNKACAAGTGSFLEEQAERLNLSVKREFADRAFSSAGPCSLGERCTVFMENSLRGRQQQGASANDIVAGLAYSIVRNYLNRVVGEREIGRKVFFQGGTASNRAVVAAFEQVLGREIIVPPNHDVTGAIGMGLIAARTMREKGFPPTSFKGFDLWRREYAVDSFGCRKCPNVCEINRVKIQGEQRPLLYGGRCERYDRRQGNSSGIPDLFAERDQELLRSFREDRERVEGENRGKKRGTIGIPRIFLMQEFLPLWSRWLTELGFEVVLSPATNASLVRRGAESVQAEACFPVKVAHGHIGQMIENADVDALLVPSYICLEEEKGDGGRGLACPYTQTIPYVSAAAFGGYPIITPRIDLEKGGTEGLFREVHRVLKPYGVRLREIRQAYESARVAQNEFAARIRRRGEEVLSGGWERAIVVVGRPYNAFDPGVNLNIHRKLIELGELPIPMDFLLPGEAGESPCPEMYWRSGQRILTAAEIIRNDPRLHAIFVTNFSCGPDSFILRYFKERMGGTPFLQIEIDEHSADAGVVTRCEAFLDSLENVNTKTVGPPREFKRRVKPGENRKRTVFIPRMTDHTVAVAAAFQACGVDAAVLPLSSPQTTEQGRRYVSGKECYPCAVTTGDMVARVLSGDFDRHRSAFFMPAGTGPCRFGQYNVLHRWILDDLGFEDVPILSPVQESSFYDELGMVGDGFARHAFDGIMAVDLLTKCLHETRPYERNGGDADELYEDYLGRIGDTIRGRNGAMPALMGEMRQDFGRIPRENGQERRPRIGIVGEIFVRSNRFSNEELVRRIEELGGEVWLAPITEWISYINHVGLRRARKRRQWRQVLQLTVEHKVQERIERRFCRHVEGLLETAYEPDTAAILRLASPYLHDSFEGEAVLSLGKTVDLFRRNASGVISAMPFGCMPGTIVSAILKAVQEDCGGPTLSIAFDGTPSAGPRLQVEAFMHQAREYAAHRKSGGSSSTTRVPHRL